MERRVDMRDISDGKLYDLDDMVKADCNDCKGCSACCRGMGTSIVLDPLDVSRLSGNLNLTFEELLRDHLELNVVDGLVLPNLKMAGKEERCSFLDGYNRCGIHKFRPGICRLFPLGRFYENRSFRYFLQVHECRNRNKSNVKVQKWIDTLEAKRYDRYIVDWHYFLKDVQMRLLEAEDETAAKTACMYLLNNFYLRLYDAEDDFYDQFDERLAAAKGALIG